MRSEARLRGGCGFPCAEPAEQEPGRGRGAARCGLRGVGIAAPASPRWALWPSRPGWPAAAASPGPKEQRPARSSAGSVVALEPGAASPARTRASRAPPSPGPRGLRAAPGWRSSRHVDSFPLWQTEATALVAQHMPRGAVWRPHTTGKAPGLTWPGCLLTRNSTPIQNQASAQRSALKCGKWLLTYSIADISKGSDHHPPLWQISRPAPSVHLKLFLLTLGLPS